MWFSIPSKITKGLFNNKTRLDLRKMKTISFPFKMLSLFQ
jgi:hypothetical protein